MLPYLLSYLDDGNDRKLLEDIYNAYAKQMYVLAKSYLHHSEDAEDAVGMVFERIAIHNFDVVREIQSEVDLRNYLLKATKNTALNIIAKKKKLRRELSLDRDTEYFLRGVADISDDGFLEELYTKMECEDVMRAIHRLDDKYKNVLYYHFVLEKTISETAKLLFQSVSATKQQLVRGKKLLLVLLAEKEEK